MIIIKYRNLYQPTGIVRDDELLLSGRPWSQRVGMKAGYLAANRYHLQLHVMIITTIISAWDVFLAFCLAGLVTNLSVDLNRCSVLI